MKRTAALALLLSLALAPGAAWAQQAPWGAPPPASPQATAWGELSSLPSEHPRCIEGSTTERVGLELLAGFGTGALILGGMMAALFIPDDRRVTEERALAVVVVGGAAALILPPLAVYGVGRAYGADGSYSAALVGNILLGFPGAVIGYEVTTSPGCHHGTSRAPVPHPRRAVARAPSRPPVIAPYFAPPTTPQGASVFGLTLQM